MNFLSLLAGLFGFLSKLLGMKRDNELRAEGRAQAEKEIQENTLETIKRREEAVNAQPKTSYDGRPKPLVDWMRRKNAGKN